MGQRRRAPRRALPRRQIFLDVGGASLREADADHFERARDPGEQIVEVVREAAGELPHCLHLLRLAQPVLGVAQPRLLAQPVADVIGELIGTDLPALLVAQDARAKLVLAGRSRRIAELDDLGELLAGEHARPAVADRDEALGLVDEQIEQTVADLRRDAEQPLELACRRAVDRQPAIAGVEHMHERIGALDDVGEQLALRQRLGDARLERRVEPDQREFGAAARGDVLEQHRDLAAARRLDPEGGERQIAAGRLELALEADRRAGGEHAAVARDPVVGLGGHHVAHLLPDDIGDAGVARIGGIRLDMDIVAERPMRSVDELDDAEALVHRIEQGAITIVALAAQAGGHPQVELRHHLAGEHFQGALLQFGELLGRRVEHAQCADRMTLARLEQRARIEAQPGVARHQRIAGEARIGGRVGDEHELVLQDRLGAEGRLERRLAHAQTDLGLEELPPLRDQIDHADRRAADVGGELGDVVEHRLARGVEDVVAVQRLEATRLGILRAGIVHACRVPVIFWPLGPRLYQMPRMRHRREGFMVQAPARAARSSPANARPYSRRRDAAARRRDARRPPPRQPARSPDVLPRATASTRRG